MDRESHEEVEWVQCFRGEDPVSLEDKGFLCLKSLTLFPVYLWDLKGGIHGQQFCFSAFHSYCFFKKSLVIVYRYSGVQRPQLEKNPKKSTTKLRLMQPALESKLALSRVRDASVNLKTLHRRWA